MWLIYFYTMSLYLFITTAYCYLCLSIVCHIGLYASYHIPYHTYFYATFLLTLTRLSYNFTSCVKCYCVFRYYKTYEVTHLAQSKFDASTCCYTFNAKLVP